MQFIYCFMIQLAAFYFLYSSSKRAVYKRGSFGRWLSQKPVVAKITGVVLLIVSFLPVIMQYGIPIGILLALVSLMTVFSCMMLLFPLIKK